MLSADGAGQSSRLAGPRGVALSRLRESLSYNGLAFCVPDVPENECQS